MKQIKRIVALTLAFVMVLQFNAFVNPGQSEAQASSIKATTKKSCAIYPKADCWGKRKATLRSSKSVTIISSTGRYYKVKTSVNGKTMYGYILKKRISVPSSNKGKSVVDYALNFVGNPYVYGGSSLTHGTDCSGFTMGVYRHFGIYLPHSSYSQRYYGKSVSSLRYAKPGDLLCYNGHVAIYMGGGKIVHAANPRSGICTSYYINASNIVSIRRFF